MICCPYNCGLIFVGAEYYSAHNDGFWCFWTGNDEPGVKEPLN